METEECLLSCVCVCVYVCMCKTDSGCGLGTWGSREKVGQGIASEINFKWKL